MPQVYVGIGSNVNPVMQLSRAFAFFKQQYTNVITSSVYQSRAVGFKGADFYNAVVGFTCDCSLEVLQAQLLAEEVIQCAGKLARFADRPLDLDLLLYGDHVHYDQNTELPRSDIIKYPFVLGPLAQIAPDRHHPVLGITYGQLWTKAQPAFKASITRCAMDVNIDSVSQV